MLKQDLVYLPRIDVVAPGEYHIFLSVYYIQVAVLIHLPYIAGIEPAVPDGIFGFIAPIIVTLTYLGTSTDDLTLLPQRHFHLPIIYLVDCPGFMIGPESEREGVERKAARLAVALSQLTVPGIPIILKRAYGVAGALHAAVSRAKLRYAWPSGEWGSLPIEGGVMAAYRKEIEAAPDPEVKRSEIEERIAQLRSPFRTAEAFEVEEIIDPRDTRPILCEFVRHAQQITATQLGTKSRVGIRP